MILQLYCVPDPEQHDPEPCPPFLVHGWLLLGLVGSQSLDFLGSRLRLHGRIPSLAWHH